MPGARKARPHDVEVARQALALQFVQEQENPVDYLLRAIEGCAAERDTRDWTTLGYILNPRFLDRWAARGSVARVVADAAAQRAAVEPEPQERPSRGPGPGLAKTEPAEVPAPATRAMVEAALTKFAKKKRVA